MSCICYDNLVFCIFFFKQKTAYEMRISDWSSDVCSSDLAAIILVAVRLVDLALAAKLGFLGPDAHAIRLDRTVAASLADRAVDEHALRRKIGRASCRERVCQYV